MKHRPGNDDFFWLSSLIFAALLPWGTNVPLRRPALIVKYLIILNLGIHLVTQGYIFNSDVSAWSTTAAREEALKGTQRYAKYLDTFALTPSQLDERGGWRWLQLISANFIHAGWMHVVLNLWIFAIYAPNLEDRFGRWRFALFLLASMIGTQLAILYLSQGTDVYTVPHRGFSGVVYAVIGAYLVCFPRSRIKLALVYDFKFWAAIAFLLVPMISIFGSTSPSLAEIILLVGVVGIFLLLQPEHARFGVPAYALLGYKLFQDFMTASQQAQNHISIWGHLGGLCVGIAAGLMVNGTRGLKDKWDDSNIPPASRQRERTEANLAKIEKEAQTDLSAARAYLGQRIFVGDAARATEFYIKTVLPKYPDLQLDSRELHSLAKMLERKGADQAALTAYEKLVSAANLQPGDEEAYMAAAHLCHRLAPERALEALKYLQLFEQNAQMMRDKLEVRRMREEILQAARERGEVTQELLEQAGDQRAQSKPLGLDRSGYGGKDQPDRRQVGRTTARMRHIESSDKWPSLKEPLENAEHDVPVPRSGGPEAVEQDSAPQQQAPEQHWGKRRLQLKTMAINRPVRTPSPDERETLEKGTPGKRPVFVELEGLVPQPPADAPPNALDSKISQRLHATDTGNDRHPANSPDFGGSEMLSDDENRITPSLSSSNRSSDADLGQRGSALKAGAEFAATALGSATPSPELRTSSQRVYSSEKAPSPSPDIIAAEPPANARWIALRNPHGGSIVPADEVQVDHLLAILSQELCRAVTVAELTESHGLIELDSEFDSDAETLVLKLRDVGLEAAVGYLPQAFLQDPLEVLNMDFGEQELVCNTVELGRLRCATANVSIIQEARVRLSTRENAPARELIEIVTLGTNSRRLQLHERTFSLSNSKHDGESIGLLAFDELGNWLEAKFGPDIFARIEHDLGYVQHEIELKRRCLFSS